MTDVSEHSAAELAELISTGAVSSRELVGATLERIAALNPRVNAVVTVDEEGALRQAEHCDRLRSARHDLGPLHGVPVTLKDCWATAGLRTTAGLAAWADHVPSADAVVVRRLRDAGAVIVGKTNLPAGVTGQETANSLFGRTGNPWDVTRTTGGSSGGAAAAVATGMAALDVGSDSGGSIRQPASFCGVYGHMATGGTVPLRGHLPSVSVDDVGYVPDLTFAGPLAHTPDDLELALDVLAGPDTDAADAWRLDLPPARATRLSEYRVALWLGDGTVPLASAVVERLEQAADALAAAGAQVRRDAGPALDFTDAERTGFALWVSAASEDIDDDSFAALQRQAADSPPENFGRPARRARAAVMPHRDWLRLDAARRRLQRAWTVCFDQVDAVLCPISPVPAYPHDPEPGRVDDLDHRLSRTLDLDDRRRPYLDQLVWPTVVGLARLPATAVPLGLTPDGLPVGGQIVGPVYGDRTTMDLARRMAELTGGFQPPPALAD